MAVQGPLPYFLLPGTAREALPFWQSVFGGDVQMHLFADMGRSDGAADAVAHGILSGEVPLYAADAGTDEKPFAAEGLLFSLLGAASPDVLKEWFAGLSEGGEVIDDLQERPWGAWDGQVRDRYGVPWLIGFEASALA